MRLQRPGRVARRLPAPEQADQQVGRHDLVGMQEEKRQHQPTLRPTQIQLPLTVPDLERPENTEVHSANVPPCSAPNRRVFLQDSRKTDGGKTCRRQSRPSTRLSAGKE